MKEDYRINLEILKYIAESKESIQSRNINIKKYSKEQIAYHVILLQERGFLNNINATHMQSTINGMHYPEYKIYNLTARGQEAYAELINKFSIIYQIKKFFAKISIPTLIITTSLNLALTCLYNFLINK